MDEVDWSEFPATRKAVEATQKREPAPATSTSPLAELFRSYGGEELAPGCWWLSKMSRSPEPGE